MPTDIEKILEYIAQYAKGYGNHMKWNEEAKLKPDMMRRMDRWSLVTTQQIREKCIDLGMCEGDVITICDMHARRFQGRCLVSQHIYDNFKFKHEA